MILSVWSGPRNLSTALMYAFAARGDFDAVDEPFYAAYLAASGVQHPMQEEILASQSADPLQVTQECAAVSAPGRHRYLKMMTHHMLPGFPQGILGVGTHVFLIRHPARVIASYAAKRESPTLSDLGFTQQAELFDRVADLTGHAPPVIDSQSVRADPKGALTRLCARIGLPFDTGMLRWPPGPKPFDGVWAPHWYGAVHRSTGFDQAEGPLPDLDSAYVPLHDLALPLYERLAKYSL